MDQRNHISQSYPFQNVQLSLAFYTGGREQQQNQGKQENNLYSHPLYYTR
jgi:hypothetical protein